MGLDDGKWRKHGLGYEKVVKSEAVKDSWCINTCISTNSIGGLVLVVR